MFLDLWTSDLRHVGYPDVPTVSARDLSPEEAGPCIGGDALHGVYFHPALQYHSQTPRSPKVRI